jgi:hypothetical protein
MTLAQDDKKLVPGSCVRFHPFRADESRVRFVRIDLPFGLDLSSNPKRGADKTNSSNAD